MDSVFFLYKNIFIQLTEALVIECEGMIVKRPSSDPWELASFTQSEAQK